MNIWECFYMLIWTETGEKAVEFENYNKLGDILESGEVKELYLKVGDEIVAYSMMKNEQYEELKRKYDELLQKYEREVREYKNLENGLKKALEDKFVAAACLGSGKKGGRKKGSYGIKGKQLVAAKKMYEEGESVTSIARRFCVNRQTIYNIAKAENWRDSKRKKYKK